MPSLATLPNELWDLVFSFLDHIQHQETIRALRLVDRRCNRLAEPLQYVRVIDCARDPPSYGDLVRSRARKVADEPRLASIVKEIRVRLFTDNEARFNKRLSVPESEIASRYGPALEHTQLVDEAKERILRALMEGSFCAFVAFLMAMCKRIEIFETNQALCAEYDRIIPEIIFYDLALWEANTLFGEISTKSNIDATTQHFISQSLREVSLLHGGHLTSSAVHRALAFLALPNLRVFKDASHSRDGEDDLGGWSHYTPDTKQLDCPSTRYVSVELDFVWMDNAAIHRLLSNSPCLTSLCIRWPNMPGPSLDNERLGDDLREYGGQLKYLYLDPSIRLNTRFHVSGAAGASSYGSFAGLSKLKCLAVPAFAFDELSDPASFLPPSLEELYVLGVGADLSFDAGHNRAFRSPYDGQERAVRSFHDARDLDPAEDPSQNGRMHQVLLQLKACEQRLPRLRKITLVPWLYFTVAQNIPYFRHRCVDYQPGDLLPIQNLTLTGTRHRYDSL